MKKIIIAFVVFIAGCWYKVGLQPISVYNFDYPTDKQIIAAMDTLWNKYPKFRLDYKSLKLMKQYDGYVRSEFFREDTTKHKNKCDSATYFNNPKIAYMGQFEFLGVNNLHFNIKSADDRFLYKIKIVKREVDSEGEFKVLFMGAWRFEPFERIAEDAEDKDKKDVRLQFEKEVVPKLEKILREIRKK